MVKKISLARIKAVGFDLDGVVYFGSKLVAGAKEIICALRKYRYRVFFITNNSTKTRQEIREKLRGLGIEVEEGDIFTSAYACALFLRQLRKKSKIMVFGSEGLKKELLKAQLNIVSTPPCNFLVVGYDINFNYEKIRLGLEALQNNAKFVACNLDCNFPGEKGRVFPACGAMVAAIAAGSGKNPDFVIGKPNAYMLELMAKQFSLKPKEIILVGDTAETDISMANKFGSSSVLVRTNNKSISKCRDMKPTFTVSSLRGLKKILKLK